MKTYTPIILSVASWAGTTGAAYHDSTSLYSRELNDIQILSDIILKRQEILSELRQRELLLSDLDHRSAHVKRQLALRKRTPIPINEGTLLKDAGKVANGFSVAATGVELGLAVSGPGAPVAAAMAGAQALGKIGVKDIAKEVGKKELEKAGTKAAEKGGEKAALKGAESAAKKDGGKGLLDKAKDKVKSTVDKAKDTLKGKSDKIKSTAKDMGNQVAQNTLNNQLNKGQNNQQNNQKNGAANGSKATANQKQTGKSPGNSNQSTSSVTNKKATTPTKASTGSSKSQTTSSKPATSSAAKKGKRGLYENEWDLDDTLFSRSAEVEDYLDLWLEDDGLYVRESLAEADPDVYWQIEEEGLWL